MLRTLTNPYAWSKRERAFPNRLVYEIRERPNIISVLPNKGREEAYLPTKQQMELLINFTF